MTEQEIRDKFDEAIARGDMREALKLIHQAEDLDYDCEKMRDIYAMHDSDSHTD